MFTIYIEYVIAREIAAILSYIIIFLHCFVVRHEIVVFTHDNFKLLWFLSKLVFYSNKKYVILLLEIISVKNNARNIGHVPLANKRQSHLCPERIW